MKSPIRTIRNEFYFIRYNSINDVALNELQGQDFINHNICSSVNLHFIKFVIKFTIQSTHIRRNGRIR